MPYHVHVVMTNEVEYWSISFPVTMSDYGLRSDDRQEQPRVPKSFPTQNEIEAAERCTPSWLLTCVFVKSMFVNFTTW